jgi:hypothetical protein
MSRPNLNSGKKRNLLIHCLKVKVKKYTLNFICSVGVNSDKKMNKTLFLGPATMFRSGQCVYITVSHCINMILV